MGSTLPVRRATARRPPLRITPALAAQGDAARRGHAASDRARRRDRTGPKRHAARARRLSGRRGRHLANGAAGSGAPSTTLGPARRPLGRGRSRPVAAAAGTLRRRGQRVLSEPAAVSRAAGGRPARRPSRLRDASDRRGRSGDRPAPRPIQAAAGRTPPRAARLGRFVREGRPRPHRAPDAGARADRRAPARRYSGTPTANSGSFGFVAGVVTVKSTIPDPGARSSASARPK